MELTKEEITALGLLPCPFCGHEAHIRPWHGGAPTKQLVACGALYDDEADICRVSPGVTGETPKEAAANWNKRVIKGEADSRRLNWLQSRKTLGRGGYFTVYQLDDGWCLINHAHAPIVCGIKDIRVAIDMAMGQKGKNL